MQKRPYNSGFPGTHLSNNWNKTFSLSYAVDNCPQSVFVLLAQEKKLWIRSQAERFFMQLIEIQIHDLNYLARNTGQHRQAQFFFDIHCVLDTGIEILTEKGQTQSAKHTEQQAKK